MKANPGGTITGEAIIGRGAEFDELWRVIPKRSVIVSAERRVGKTSLLRKMESSPPDGWIPLLIFVEDARHPIDFVAELYSEAARKEAQSKKGAWMARLRSKYERLAGVEISGWKLPELATGWKELLGDLMEDIATNTDHRVVVMIDEFPMMLSNVLDTPRQGEGAALAMEFLDALRRVRQRYEPTDQIRFVFSGSIGLHLILKDLKENYGYKGNPTNDMARKLLEGMTAQDVSLMCDKFLDEEGIAAESPAAVRETMFKRTGGLPLYIQYVCERLQDSGTRMVTPELIDETLRQMMDSVEVEWFNNAAERVDGYYKRLGRSRMASVILNFLSRDEGLGADPPGSAHERQELRIDAG